MIQYKYLPEMDVVGETNPACKGGKGERFEKREGRNPNPNALIGTRLSSLSLSLLHIHMSACDMSAMSVRLQLHDTLTSEYAGNRGHFNVCCMFVFVSLGRRRGRIRCRRQRLDAA